MDRGGWPVTVCRVAKSQTRTEVTLHACTCYVTNYCYYPLSHTHTPRLQRKINQNVFSLQASFSHWFIFLLWNVESLPQSFCRRCVLSQCCRGNTECATWQWLQQERQCRQALVPRPLHKTLPAICSASALSPQKGDLRHWVLTATSAPRNCEPLEVQGFYEALESVLKPNLTRTQFAK